MSDINSNEQNNSIWVAGNNSVQPAFTSDSDEEPKDIVYMPEREVKRESLYDMNAIAGRSQVINKKPVFQANQTLEDKDAGVKITQDRVATMTNDMQPFIKQRPSVVMRASALGDFAFGSAIKEKLTDPYAKAALIEFAAAQELADQPV